MDRERGMVTAEAALAITSLVTVALFLTGAFVVGAAAVRCNDAAREAVRVLARGDDGSAAAALVAATAPRGSVLSSSSATGTVTVTVRCPAGSPGGWLPRVVLNGGATAAREETAGGL